MDGTHFPKAVILFTLFLFITTTAGDSAKGHDDASPLPGPRSKGKVPRFRSYWHDVLSGKNPTSITIVRSPSALSSLTVFGQVQIIDNLLTDGPEMTSKPVGRCQGIYASAGQKDLALLMAMNVVFTEGRREGTTAAPSAYWAGTQCSTR